MENAFERKVAMYDELVLPLVPFNSKNPVSYPEKN